MDITVSIRRAFDEKSAAKLKKRRELWTLVIRRWLSRPGIEEQRSMCNFTVILVHRAEKFSRRDD